MLHDQGHFFVVLDADTRTKPPRLVVEVHRVSKGMVRRRPLKWKEINGKVRIPTCEFSFDCRN